MKKFIILLTCSIFCAYFSHAQVGINTVDPKATLDIVSNPSDLTTTDGVIAPRLTGNELKAKDGLYGTEQTGTLVYATAAANPATDKTQNITVPGYYYFDGLVWVALKSTNTASTDATRFLGGTVYVRMNSVATGDPSLDDSKVIGGGNGHTYAVGTLSQTSAKGGIVSLEGQGYTISNPSNGIFDILFDVPMTEIYGISVNIVDAYGKISGTVPNGTYPVPGTPGESINSMDNTQVSFISDDIIRVKTGNASGGESNRPFTFLVTGK